MIVIFCVASGNCTATPKIGKSCYEWSNKKLMQEVESYIVYVKELTKLHKIKDFLILVDYKREKQTDNFIFSTIFYQYEVLNSHPNNYKIIRGDAVLLRGNSCGNSQLDKKSILHISKKYLGDDITPVPTAHQRQLAADINITGDKNQKQKTKIKSGIVIINSADSKYVDIAPKRWYLKFVGDRLISESKDKDEKVAQ
jgi:hypothetical protein